MFRPHRAVLAAAAVGSIAALIAPANAAPETVFDGHVINCQDDNEEVAVKVTVKGDHAVLWHESFSLGDISLSGGEVEAEYIAKARQKRPRLNFIGLAEVTPRATMAEDSVKLENKSGTAEWDEWTKKTVWREIGFSVAVGEVEHTVLTLDEEHCLE